MPFLKNPLKIGFDATDQRMAVIRREAADAEIVQGAEPAAVSVEEEIAQAMHDLDAGPAAIRPDEKSRKRSKNVVLRNGISAELEHSMVTTFRYAEADQAKADGTVTCSHQDAVLLPNRILEGLDHKGTLACVIGVLEKYVFGRSTFEMLTMLAATTSLLIVCVAADYASANQKALLLLIGQLVMFRTNGMNVMGWFERCGLHQCGRSAIQLMVALEIPSSMYSMSRLFKRRRYKRLLLKALEDMIESEQEWEPHIPPPANTATSDSWRALLLETLVGSWSDLGVEGEGEEHSQLHEAVEDWVAFNNGDVVNGSRCHFCQSRGCHRDLAHVKQHGKALMLRMVHLCCSTAFEPGKWLKSLSSPLFWARLELIHKSGSQAFFHLPVQKHEADEAADPSPDTTEADALSRLAGKRFGTARRWISGDKRRFELALYLALCLRLESVVSVLFWSSHIIVSKTRRIFKPCTAADGTRKARASSRLAERQEKLEEHSMLFLVVEAVEQFLVDTWTAFKSPMDVGLASGAQVYAPTTLGRSEICRITRKASLNLIGGMYFRFCIRHRTYPLKHVETETMTDDQVCTHYDEWVDAPGCCKTPNVDVPLDRHCQKFPVAERPRAFRGTVKAWLKLALRSNTLREEHLHTTGQNAVSSNKFPLSWPFIVATVICKSLRAMWEALGLRRLSEAPDKVMNAYTQFTMTAKSSPSYKRKKTGSPSTNNLAFEHANRELGKLPEGKLDQSDPIKIAKRKELVQAYIERFNNSDHVQQEALTYDAMRLRTRTALSIAGAAVTADCLEPAPALPRLPFGVSGDQSVWPVDPKAIDAFIAEYKFEPFEKLRLAGVHKAIIDMYRKASYPNRVRMSQAAIKAEYNVPVTETMFKEHSFVTTALDAAACATEEMVEMTRKTCQVLHHGVCKAEPGCESCLVFISAMARVTKVA